MTKKKGMRSWRAGSHDEDTSAQVRALVGCQELLKGFGTEIRANLARGLLRWATHDIDTSASFELWEELKRSEFEE